MEKRDVFRALRATTIAALCAGTGAALGGCGRAEEPKSDAPARASPARPAEERGDGGDVNCASKDK